MLEIEHMKVDGGDEPQEGAAERRRIHGNSAEFEHLEQHNMDQLCARVVLTGVKPHWSVSTDIKLVKFEEEK